MIAVIEQALGEIHRRDAEFFGLPLQRDDELMGRTTPGISQLESGIARRFAR